VVGKEIPIDAAHADALRGVLTHLVRNAVAHGIEVPNARERAGKRPVGAIRLECGRDGGAITIEVEDDGAGFDAEALAAKALTLGIKAEGDLTKLAFIQGVSTAARQGELAGRGVGLSAVERDLAAIGYSVTVLSEKGKGSRVRVRSSDQDELELPTSQ